MVSASDLRAELAHVPTPPGSGFTVRDVPAAPGYKVGRGADGAVALLTPFDPMPGPPTRLRTLSLDPRVSCKLQAADGSDVIEEHGLVQLYVEDDHLLEPFLGVAAVVVRLLGSDPAPGEVTAAMRHLVRIFDRAEPPRGSVLGLFGELLLIVASSDPAAMVDAWHAKVDARFDFSGVGSRLEAKTTSGDDRVHHFNLRQLVPVEGATVCIASMLTTETSAGTSIGTLVNRIEHQLAGDSARQMKVHEQVAATLGADWARHLGRCFDEHEATTSLAFLDPADVPQVDPPPAEVLEVSLLVDCSDVPHDPAPPGLAALVAPAGGA